MCDLKLRVTLSFGERRIELPAGSYTVGRSSQCAIRVNESQVSREHLEIVVEENAVSVADLGSKNGTKVNGIPLKRPTVLAHDDRIGVGSVELHVSLIPDNEFYFEEDTITLTGTDRVSLVGAEIPSCPHCEAVLPSNEDAVHCPFCGKKLQRPTSYTAEFPVLDPGPDG